MGSLPSRRPENLRREGQATAKVTSFPSEGLAAKLQQVLGEQPWPSAPVGAVLCRAEATGSAALSSPTRFTWPEVSSAPGEMRQEWEELCALRHPHGLLTLTVRLGGRAGCSDLGEDVREPLFRAGQKPCSHLLALLGDTGGDAGWGGDLPQGGAQMLGNQQLLVHSLPVRKPSLGGKGWRAACRPPTPHCPSSDGPEA